MDLMSNDENNIARHMWSAIRVRHARLSWGRFVNKYQRTIAVATRIEQCQQMLAENWRLHRRIERAAKRRGYANELMWLDGYRVFVAGKTQDIPELAHLLRKRCNSYRHVESARRYIGPAPQPWCARSLEVLRYLEVQQ